MKKSTRTAAIASALTAGIAGLALSAPLAMAAPTATPSATGKPAATNTPKATATNTAKATSTPSATSTPTATRTPTQAPVGPLSVSASAPESLTAPVVVNVSGATSDTISASIGEPGTDKVVSSGSGRVVDHSARTVLSAPKDGWIPSLTYEVRVEVNGTVVTKHFTTPAGSKTGTGTLTPPSSSTAPAVVHMKGLTPGTKMSASVGPDGTDGAEIRSYGPVGKDGTITLSIPAPKGGWVDGQKYTVVVDQEGMGDHFYEASFTFHGGKSTGGGTTTTKDSSGGLAKTGV
ncbi:hypothetical protein BI335_18995 [Enemella evansiae]|uniref:hypothetical protein n=1 Tax=Enemella evansiae TaxID=2016499 RepID=UPI000B978925|nr:hypothetical protein [Enemella evansiae]OYO09408.1 hypothetical protein BI335_18995 [Enemella evansiae]